MWGWIGCIASFALIISFVVYVFVFKKSESISLDDIVGEKCTVIETIDNYAGCGMVKIKGTQWSARCVNDDDVFEAGESLVVVAIEGVKLICNKK